ncbi:hypothetical protein ACUOA8_61275, partial [Escherichia sp. SS-MK2]
SHEKLAQLVAMLAQFEQHIEDDSPLVEVLPSVYNKYPVRYRDYTLRQLSQLHSVLINSGGKPREAGTTGGDAV